MGEATDKVPIGYLGPYPYFGGFIIFLSVTLYINVHYVHVGTCLGHLHSKFHDPSAYTYRDVASDMSKPMILPPLPKMGCVCMYKKTLSPFNFFGVS